MSQRLVWHKDEVRDVISLLLSCKTSEETEHIFDRILTPREINDIARRHKALTMIDEGKSYADIKLATGMSAVTVSRLSAKCGYGFKKSSGLSKTNNQRQMRQSSRKTLKYKGVSVAKEKR